MFSLVLFAAFNHLVSKPESGAGLYNYALDWTSLIIFGIELLVYAGVFAWLRRFTRQSFRKVT